MPTIEGASPEQRRLLEEILEGFGATRISRLVVRPFRGGGFSSTRTDVECCAPFLGLSRPIDWQGPPPCPVFG